MTSTKGVLFNFQVRVPYPVLFRNFVSEWESLFSCCGFSHDNLLVTNYIQKEYLQYGYLKVMDFFLLILDLSKLLF